MEKKTINKLNKALIKLTEAATYLCQADDDLLTEPSMMVSKNMTLKETINQMYKDVNFVKTSLTYTISAVNNEIGNTDIPKRKKKS